MDRLVETNFSLPSDKALYKTVTSLDALFDILEGHAHPVGATMSGRM